MGQTVLSVDDNVLRAEEHRIQQAYARRRHVVPEDRYSALNFGNLLRLQEIERNILLLLSHNGYANLSSMRVLEVGCGNGYWLRKFIQWGAHPQNLAGIDLLEDSIAEARNLSPARIIFRCASAADLDFPEASFDILCQFTVFSSILDPRLKHRIAREMLRVLAPSGAIVWYDLRFSNPSNPDVRGISPHEVRALFPNCKAEFRRITLMPPLARAVGRVAPILCTTLSSLRVLCTHCLGLITKQ